MSADRQIFQNVIEVVNHTNNMPLIQSDQRVEEMQKMQNSATVALDQDSQDIQQQRLNVPNPLMNDCEVEIVQESQILEEPAPDKKEEVHQISLVMQLDTKTLSKVWGDRVDREGEIEFDSELETPFQKVVKKEGEAS
ncbi:hypothetical protein VNO80_21327 [Phaseolus coccineus]|uniref:Uncharacterized protein n=1 Tax=Phaseolus coccineus TaxID=3886 RepID=A0AAN9QT73_PHACN